MGCRPGLCNIRILLRDKTTHRYAMAQYRRELGSYLIALFIDDHSISYLAYCILTWDCNRVNVSLTQDATQDLLAVMLSTSTLTIWNSSTGNKINRVTFSETIEAFTFCPFQSEILVCEFNNRSGREGGEGNGRGSVKQ